MVDGKARFAPDQPSSIDRSNKIINYIEIDAYMVLKANEEKFSGSKLTYQDDVSAFYKSPRLLVDEIEIESFERNIMGRAVFDI